MVKRGREKTARYVQKKHVNGKRETSILGVGKNGERIGTVVKTEVEYTILASSLADFQKFHFHVNDIVVIRDESKLGSNFSSKSFRESYSRKRKTKKTALCELMPTAGERMNF